VLGMYDGNSKLGGGASDPPRRRDLVCVYDIGSRSLQQFTSSANRLFPPTARSVEAVNFRPDLPRLLGQGSRPLHANDRYLVTFPASLSDHRKNESLQPSHIQRNHSVDDL
jgi:hypothetical protein